MMSFHLFLGGALALAIALHNIPEGICVSMPVYFATGSRIKAFLWAFLSGVSEPLGKRANSFLRTWHWLLFHIVFIVFIVFIVLLSIYSLLFLNRDNLFTCYIIIYNYTM